MTTRDAELDMFDAIARGDSEMVEQLLSSGVSANARNNGDEPALLYAALDGQDGCVEKLLAHGASTDNLPMLAAAVPDDPTVMRRFLTMGGDPNALDADGRAPIMEAANWGHMETIRLLIRHGVDPHRKMNGFSPAEVARKWGHLEAAEFLEQSPAHDASIVSDK